MIKKLLDFFRKKKVKSIGFTTETADIGFNSKEEIFKELRSKKQISHDELNVLSDLYFNVTFKNTFYRFRNSDNYGQYFQIKDFYLVTDISKTELIDITMVLHDDAFGTSLKIHVSVKDLNEIFENFVPNFNLVKNG